MLIRKAYTDNISKELLGYVSKGLMRRQEQFFISGIIREYNPGKILEVGVASGASSIVILDALGAGGKLYSHDYSNTDFSTGKPAGYLLDFLPEMKKNRILRTGGMCCNYLDEFCSDGEKFDLCFLDTAHRNPGEFLDFLQILPYMKKGGILILHDISLHALKADRSPTCCILYSAVKGQKILPAGDFSVNIGAVVLDDDIMDNIFDIFNCLRLPWEYKISKEDMIAVKKCFAKHYSKELLQLFEEFCNRQTITEQSSNHQLFRFIKAVKNNLWV